MHFPPHILQDLYSNLAVLKIKGFFSGHESYRENQHLVASHFPGVSFYPEARKLVVCIVYHFFHKLDCYSCSQVFRKRKRKLNSFNFRLLVLDSQKDFISQAFQVTGQRTKMIENYSK